jgi:hypothetical protein
MNDADRNAGRAAQVAELGFAEAVARANGYDTSLVDDDDPHDIPELIVALDPDEEDRPRSLHLSFVQTDEQLEHTKVLQLWSPLPFAAGEDCNLADLRLAVAIVNEHVGLGHFGVQADGTLYFRHDIVAPKHQLLDDDMLAEVVALADFHQIHFSDYLEGVCDGEISVLVLDEVITRSE